MLDLAGRNRRHRIEIGDLLQATLRAGGNLPDADTVRNRLRTDDTPLIGVPTLADWLNTWLQRGTLDDNTRRGYESHVRVHLIPHIGDVVLDKLRPHHIEDLIDKIKQRNADIATAKASPDPDTRASVRGVRPTGPATIARIRATLRNNDALARAVVSGVTNPATLVKTPNARAKPIVWEPERVAR
ncbi:hypothetical protein [Micromonospora chersina]|uniref:hypothetical protein n=1 Tax=Micromonospora chersina TaxID=47854 RepID=UPI0033FC0AA8